MAAFLQTMFSNSFSLNENCWIIWFKFHSNSFPVVQLAISQKAKNWRCAILWTVGDSSTDSFIQWVKPPRLYDLDDRTYDKIIMSFWRNNDVIITMCVSWPCRIFVSNIMKWNHDKTINRVIKPALVYFILFYLILSYLITSPGCYDWYMPALACTITHGGLFHITYYLRAEKPPVVFHLRRGFVVHIFNVRFLVSLDHQSEGYQCAIR